MATGKRLPHGPAAARGRGAGEWRPARRLAGGNGKGSPSTITGASNCGGNVLSCASSGW